MTVTAADLGEATEGKLVAITGTGTGPARKSTSGDLTLDLLDGAGHPFRELTDGSSGITPADLPTGKVLRITGVAGQRASRKGVLDGYCVWARDRADIAIVANPASRTPPTPPP